MVSIVENNLDQIREACKSHHVKALYLVGSGARAKDFNDQSDLDFLVEFNYTGEVDNENVFERVHNRESFESFLKKITRRDVDLLQEKNIKNKYLRYFINKDKTLIYGIS